MDLRVIDSGWKAHFRDAMRGVRSQVRWVCPFLQLKTIRDVLGTKRPRLRVITRFSLSDFQAGVSDLDALELLLNLGGEVRGVRNLHAKVYLFDSDVAIVTSANLTNAALRSNLEYGIVGRHDHLLNAVCAYFEDLWDRAGRNLKREQLADWREQIARAARSVPPRPGFELPDYGNPVPGVADDTVGQVFVKFFGESHSRADRSTPVLEQVERSGCHWACTYPRNKRPRTVRTGALLYMGRMVRHPNDILIYGHAVGRAYVADRDDAPPEEIRRRPWKTDWPHYIRVTAPVFVDGRLANGVSLNELMETFGSDSFASTQRNRRSGAGNTNPRLAYRQLAVVELSPKAARWLDAKFAEHLAVHGQLKAADLADLDWP